MRGGGGDPLLTSSFPQAVNFGGSREAQDEGFSRGSLYLALHMPGCKPQGLVRGREQRRENVQSGFLGRQGCPIQGLQIGEGPIRIHLSSAPAKALTPAPSRGVRASPPVGWAPVAFLPGGAARKHIATAAGTSFLQQDGMVCPMNCPGIPLKGGPSPEAALTRLSCPSLTPPPPPLPPRRPWGPAVTPAPLARCVPAPGPLGWPQCAASALLRLWLKGAGERREHPTGLAGQQPLITSLAWFLGENETSLSPTEGRFPWKGSEMFRFPSPFGAPWAAPCFLVIRNRELAASLLPVLSPSPGGSCKVASCCGS